MNSEKITKGSLQVDSALVSFVENDVLEGLTIRKEDFWKQFEEFLKEYGPLANQFLKSRDDIQSCLLYTSPSPRDLSTSRMPSSA